jgi:chromosomal replication initiator protein
MKNSELIIKMKVLLMDETIDEIERILMIRKMSYKIRRPGKLTLEEVSELVEQHTGIPSNSFCEKNRKRKFALPRQLAHALAKKTTDETLASIGDYFGGLNHATVLNSVKKVGYSIETDKRFKAEHEQFLNF